MAYCYFKSASSWEE